jgi:HD-GYP domain-containing protein (c-di-GMP phosphodiesterase class II)
MKTIPVTDLRAGTLFPMPVYIDEENMLVPAGVPLRQKDIEKLVSWGIQEVMTDGDIPAPQAAAPAAAARPAAAQVKPPAASAASPPPASPSRESGGTQDYAECVKQTEALFAEIQTNAATAQAITARVGELVKQIQALFTEGRQECIAYALNTAAEARLTGVELAKSAVDAALFAALCAGELNYPAPKQGETVTAAFLHNTGLLKLPPALLNSATELSIEEIQYMQTHTLYGYALIHQRLGYPETTALTALQHHERWDGKGYPLHVSGPETTVEARLMSILDSFRATLIRKPYQEPMAGHEIVKTLAAQSGIHFDPACLKFFVKIVGVYPIGSVVSLSSGQAARIIEVRKDAPSQPKVRLLETGTVVDLLTEKGLTIARKTG